MEVTRELVLPAPPDEVWEALTDPERLREWFANDVEQDGDAVVFRWGDGEVRRATFVEVDEPRRLGFRWSDPEAPEEETCVTFELEEDEDGTRLTVTEEPSTGTTSTGTTSAGWTTALELRALAFAHA